MTIQNKSGVNRLNTWINKAAAVRTFHHIEYEALCPFTNDDKAA